MKPFIAIDIGSAVTKIYKAGADVVLTEPTLIAYEDETNKKVYKFGTEAKKSIGKTPENVCFIYPVCETEIKNEKALETLLSYFFSKIKGGFFEKKPSVLLSVQCGAERENIKKYEKVFNDLGYYDISYIESPVLSLIGCNAPLTDVNPCFIIDFGAGQTTIAAITLSGIISGVSVNLGGNYLDKLIATHIENVKGLKISEEQTEKIKISLASLIDRDEMKTVVSGRDVMSGKARSMQISAEVLVEPIKLFLDKIIEIVNMIIAKIPADSIVEIKKNGIYLTGGGSGIVGLETYLNKAIGIKTQVAENAGLCAVIGGGIAVENKELLQKLKLR